MVANPTNLIAAYTTQLLIAAYTTLLTAAYINYPITKGNFIHKHNFTQPQTCAIDDSLFNSATYQTAVLCIWV